MASRTSAAQRQLFWPVRTAARSTTHRSVAERDGFRREGLVVATRAREQMCAVNVSVEAVIASGPEDAQELAGRRRLAALGCISSPPGTGAPRRSRLFRSFPSNVCPPGTPGDPSVAPKKRRGPRRISPPPIFRGADTRTHHRIRAGRSDAGILLPARDRGSASDSATHAPPLSPRPRRASASDRPSRSPPRSCRPTCLAKPDYAPTQVLGSSRLASRCITNY